MLNSYNSENKRYETTNLRACKKKKTLQMCVVDRSHNINYTIIYNITIKYASCTRIRAIITHMNGLNTNYN